MFQSDLPELTPELLEGELLISKVEKVLKLKAFNSTGATGNLYCTNFKISFVTMSSDSSDVSIFCRL